MIRQGRFCPEPPPLIQVLGVWHFYSSTPLYSGLFWLTTDPLLPEFSLLVLLSSVARGPRNSVLFSDGMLADDLSSPRSPCNPWPQFPLTYPYWPLHRLFSDYLSDKEEKFGKIGTNHVTSPFNPWVIIECL